MKPKTLFLIILQYSLLNRQAFCEYNSLSKNEIRQIAEAIQKKSAKWTAGENPMTRVPFEAIETDDERLFKLEFLDKIPRITLSKIQNLPSHFDWRDNNGNWVTPVRDQYTNQCGSCGVFSVVAQTESWLKIKNSDPNTDIDLSEQFIVSCGNIGSCSTGFHSFFVLDFLQSTGVPPEACMPYAGKDLSCGLACPDWKDQCTKIPGWGVVAYEKDLPITEKVKNAVYRQPVASGMWVQHDFQSYLGGVYEPVWGSIITNHMVLIVGWDDAEQCWICKNSWGEEWGEDGFFRIKWGACNIGINVPIIWCNSGEMVDSSIQPKGLDLSLTYGDIVKETFTFFNHGIENVEYSTFAFKVNTSPVFHPDAFNSFDGMSLWSGNPDVNGYSDCSIQYLDLPCLNLTETIQPKLTFMANWAVETPSASPNSIDGFDGCNVWISTDNGKSFRVVPQMIPPYNCKWLASYTWSVWLIGNNIPGWCGFSYGWKPAELDLSPFKTDSVVIRFAFASDMGYCTLNDSRLKGFFIDEIRVADGETALFENHGDTLADMRIFGAEMTTDSFWVPEKANWINISNGVGSIAPGDSSILEISINTRNLVCGHHNALMMLSYNNEGIWTSSNHLPIRMQLNKPDHDVGIDDVWPYGPNMPVLIGQNRVKIHNYGANDETDFQVFYQLTKDGQPCFEESTSVPFLAADDSMVITFRPYWGTEDAEYDRSISIQQVSGDYNAFNNSRDNTIHFSHMLDDFESTSGLWDFQGGWGITNMHKHSGRNSVHVNSGSKYTADADAAMTLKQALDVSSLGYAELHYWTNYQSQMVKDRLYVEASTDSVTWAKLDSLTGISDWVEERIDLSGMLNSGTDKLWLRFHFMSDDRIQKWGFFIDDIQIYLKPTDSVEEAAAQPGTWDLAQNYPNPFNPGTSILYALPQNEYVEIKIHDLLGREIRTLFAGDQTAGLHRVEWDGLDNHGQRLAYGIYFYTLNAKDFRKTRKLVLLR
jgi:C1A family cysteine protease